MSWCDHVNHNCNQDSFLLPKQWVSYKRQNIGQFALNDAEQLWMGLWTRCPEAVDCLGEATGVWSKGKATVNKKNDKEEYPFSIWSTTQMCVWSFFPVETYKEVETFPLINHAVSVALAVLDACWTMQ